MKKMKRFLAVLLSFCCFVLTGCLDKVLYIGYTEEEVGIINAKFDSFQNSKNFAIQDSHVIALIDKSVTIGTDKLYCNGKKINENTSHLIGCGEQYFYVSDSVMTGFRTIRLHVMQVDYNTLEMKEIMQIENSSRFPYSFCKDGKIYIRNEERYCICDIASGEKQWVNSTSFDEFNEMRKESKYSFDIEEKKITITSSETKEKKVVSFEKDLEDFEEGVYIKEVNAKLERSYFRFEAATIKDGICYFLSVLPLQRFGHGRAIIFAYDFESGELSYYSSCNYFDYEDPTYLTIIDR